jgi:hypothetical protein
METNTPDTGVDITGYMMKNLSVIRKPRTE